MRTAAYEMRISDWRSDVCSSDLFPGGFLSSAQRLCPRVRARLRPPRPASPASPPACHWRRRMHDPFKITQPTCISFSGGRTSAYMLWRVLQTNGGLPADTVVCFANTGKEVEATLRFVRDCAEHRSEEHTSELQSLMRISYAVICLK